MATLTYLTGDATAPVGEGPKLLAHVCNNRGGWGQGFVLALSKMSPLPEEKYKAWARSTGNNLQLGKVQLVHISEDLTVANLVAQDGYISRENPTPLNYTALRTCLEKIATHESLAGYSVHMPRIGAGLGGGNWEAIEQIIDKALVKAGIDVTVYTLPKKEKD